MAQPKLSKVQRGRLLAWLAAGHSNQLIFHTIAQQRKAMQKPPGDETLGDDGEPFASDWPAFTLANLSYYRKRHGPTIEKLRSERHATALDSGLAVKAERVERLKAHADRLEMIKWEASENGRLWNEKAWRETLDDIAKELGHRRQGMDITLARELEAFLDRLRETLDEETYARVLACAAGGTPADE